VDDAGFETAARVLGMVTNSFYVPLDAHRVLVARDTKENRQQFQRQEMETVYLPGLTSAELTEVGNLAKNVFDVQQAVVRSVGGDDHPARAGEDAERLQRHHARAARWRSQVLLQVRMIQLAHTNTRNTGIQPPQSITAFNVYTEEQSILNANAVPGAADHLLGPGRCQRSLWRFLAFCWPPARYRAPCSPTALLCLAAESRNPRWLPARSTANLNLNSSDSRELDQIQLRLGDGEAGTLRMGDALSHPDLFLLEPVGQQFEHCRANRRGNLQQPVIAALLAGSSSVPNVPQVEYQDLGLTLKATPKVMRNDEVALTIDMKIDALSRNLHQWQSRAQQSIAYSGVVTLKQGEGVVVISELDKQESRAISGVPGLSEIPGLNNLTGKTPEELRHAADRDYAPRDSRHTGRRPLADDAGGAKPASVCAVSPSRAFRRIPSQSNAELPIQKA
jgi:general secretion pathway protein D